MPSFTVKFPILVYHQIGIEINLDYLVFEKKLFAEQMVYIRRRFWPVALGRLMEMINRSEPIPPNAVVITFDDGYASTFSHAFPILQQHQIPATLFITTGFIDRSVSAPYRAKMLSWKMIQEMHRSGIECGAHTVTHPNLSSCDEPKSLYEIKSSKDRIEQKIQSSVKTFAYPYGHSQSFTKMTQKWVRQSGYIGACTTIPGQNGHNTNPFALRRISLAKSQIRYFAMQCSELSQGNLPAHERAELSGMNQKVIKLWKARYWWLDKRLKRDDFFPLKMKMARADSFKWR